MLVFWKQRLVLLAVPKTGSTALEQALSPLASLTLTAPPELRHAPLYRYNRFLRPMYEKVCDARLETVAVIREPVSWLGSWYRYRARPALKGSPNSTDGISFDDFVRAYLRPDPEPFANVGSQARFLEPRPNGTCINHLFAYENQPALLAFLTQRLGPFPLPARRNVSPPAALSLAPGVARRLREKCAADFALWQSASAQNQTGVPPCK